MESGATANRRSEAEGYIRFVLRHRGWVLLAVAAVTVFFCQALSLALDKAAAVFAGFWEEDVDPARFLGRVREIEARGNDGNNQVYFTGYPVLYAYLYPLAPQVYRVLVATLVLMIGLLLPYFRTWPGVFLPVLSAAVSAVWGLGFASLLGYSLDPLVLVVPLIITARALSHSVQSMARFREEYQGSADYGLANRRAVETTGRTIVFTATTLIAGVIFWVFIDLKFQAEMGLLLALLMFLNRVNALVFIPCLVTAFKPRFVRERSV